MKRVLLATDGSTNAEEAAWFLSHLPHVEQLDLRVVTVLQIPQIYARQSPSSMSESVDRERRAAKEAYQRVAEMFEGANVHIRQLVAEGHRGKTIVDVARREKSDLVVLGARGQSAVRRLLLGSTSDFVATHAHCSVLVVRPTGIRESKRPVRITIGYEDAAPAQAALREFSQTQWGSQSDVHIVSVVSYVSAFLNEIVVDSEETKSHALAAIQRATEQVRSAAPNVQGHLVESDHIGEGLIEFIEEHQSDLIVVGESSHTMLGRVLLGSVSRFVLRHAPCSVWITRNVSASEQAESLAGQAEAPG